MGILTFRSESRLSCRAFAKPRNESAEKMNRELHFWPISPEVELRHTVCRVVSKYPHVSAFSQSPSTNAKTPDSHSRIYPLLLMSHSILNY